MSLTSSSSSSTFAVQANSTAAAGGTVSNMVRVKDCSQTVRLMSWAVLSCYGGATGLRLQMLLGRVHSHSAAFCVHMLLQAGITGYSGKLKLQPLKRASCMHKYVHKHRQLSPPALLPAWLVMLPTVAQGTAAKHMVGPVKASRLPALALAQELRLAAAHSRRAGGQCESATRFGRHCGARWW